MTGTALNERVMPARVSHDEERNQLLEEVERMDNSFEASQIAEDEYHRLRAAKMARLIALHKERRISD